MWTRATFQGHSQLFWETEAQATNLSTFLEDSKLKL